MINDSINECSKIDAEIKEIEIQLEEIRDVKKPQRRNIKDFGLFSRIFNNSYNKYLRIYNEELKKYDEESKRLSEKREYLLSDKEQLNNRKQLFQKN